MKIIFFSCAHYKETSPINRNDGYGDQILHKIDQIQYRAKEDSATIVCLGDLTDKKYNTTIKEAYKIMGIIDADVPWYLLMGNHDIQAYNPDISTQLAGLLQKSDRVKLIKNDNEIMFDDVLITGEPYHADYEVEDTYNRDSGVIDCDYHIHCTHGMITESSVPWDSWTAPQIEAILECDLLLNGHNHKPFEFGRIVNTGSVARIAKKQNNLNRIPSYVIFDTETKEYERVELEYDPDVWIETEERDTMDNEQIHEFIEEMKEMDVESSDILDMLLRDIAKNVKEVFYNYIERR